MSIISRSATRIFTSTILRKIFHIIFSLLLIVPFTTLYRQFILGLAPWVPEPTLLTFTILLFVASILNSIQIRMPDLRERFLRITIDFRNKVVEGLQINGRGKPYVEIVDNFLKTMIRYEEKLLELISIVERDYEVKYGYVCITFGLLSVTMSYVFFKNFAIYGILALAIVDTVSSITTYFTPRRRKVYKHSDISIAITLAVFTLILYLLTMDLAKSLAISIASVVVELISPEDNLTLPIITSLIAYILNVRELLL
jgi:dolichol kinase